MRIHSRMHFSSLDIMLCLQGQQLQDPAWQAKVVLQVAQALEGRHLV